MPAPELETLIADLVSKHLSIPAVQTNIVCPATTEEIASIAQRMTGLSVAASSDVEKTKRAVLSLIERVQIAPGKLLISIAVKAIAEHLALEQERISDEYLSIESDFRLRKRGVETKLILADAIGARDDTLFRNIALAHRYFDMIRSGKTYKEIAKAEGASKRRIQQLVELAFLAPDVIRDVWEGRQPVGLASQWLKSHAFTPMWNEQRELFMAL